MKVFHWLALAPAGLWAAVIALALVATLSQTGCQVPSLNNAMADAGQWPGRTPGPSPPGEVTAQPKYGAACTTASAPNRPPRWTRRQAPAAAAGTMADLTLQRHSREKGRQ
eukprot:2315389-Alexandrium_andersonii.AAC.1